MEGAEDIVDQGGINMAPSSSLESAEEEHKAEVSALRENILQKGRNSYYYAHERTIDAPKWDGNEQPRLLRKQASQSATRTPQAITNYAWADEEAKVKIYISLDGVGELAADDIELNWGEETMSILLKNLEEKDFGLHIPKLHSKIVGATYKQKPNKIIVTLKKEMEVSWFELKKD